MEIAIAAFAKGARCPRGGQAVQATLGVSQAPNHDWKLFQDCSTAAGALFRPDLVLAAELADRGAALPLL